jgi:O-antigen/teichoic acid export membrane protein
MTVTDAPTVEDAGRRLARLGLAAAMVSRLLGRLVGIVLVMVLARFAGDETVAVYGYLLGTATLVTMLTDLGVASVAGREVAAGRMPADGALRAALGPQVVSVVVAALVTVLLTVVWGPADVPSSALLLTVLFVLAGGLVNLWAEVLRATGRVLLEGALQFGSALALVVVGSVVILAGGSASDLLLVVLLKEVAVLAVSVVLLRPRHSAVATRDLLTQGLWMAVASTAVILLWRQGTLVVGGMGSVGALATFVVATRFFDAGVTVAHTAGFGLVPGLSALATDPVAFRSAARQYLKLAALAGLAIAVVGWFVAGPITTIPFGDRWADAVPAVRVVALSALPVLVSYVAFTMYLARGQMRWLTGSAIGGTVAGLASTVALMAWRPDALSGVLGTTIGATVLVVLLFVGLRDLFRRSD